MDSMFLSSLVLPAKLSSACQTKIRSTVIGQSLPEGIHVVGLVVPALGWARCFSGGKGNRQFTCVVPSPHNLDVGFVVVPEILAA